MRQHVNPLSRVHQVQRPLPPLEDLFARPSLPLHLDIGSARGRFLLAMARLHPLRNHLGVEIRRPLVEAAEAERIGVQGSGAADPIGLERTNLRFVYNNASVNLGPWLERLPNGCLELVTIQFPDPWFKKKHQKRRVLQPALLRGIATALAPGGALFLQSDVPAVMQALQEPVEASGSFDLQLQHPTPWPAATLTAAAATTPAGPWAEPCPETEENPLPVATEREVLVLSRGLPVYRALYHRNANPLAAPGGLAGEDQATDNPDGAPACPAPIPPV